MISADMLTEIGAAVRQNAELGSLRQRFPGLSFSECDEDDVPARVPAVLDAGGYRLYLVSGTGGHCLALTDDPEAATGVVVATKADDE